LREDDGLGHTSGITSGLLKTIGVVSSRTFPCHVTSQCERKCYSRLVWYASNALLPSFVKVSKVGLRMLPLSRPDPLWPEFSPFMLDMVEVVDYPMESKCVYTRNEQEPETPARNWANWMAQFGKPDCSILSGPTTVRGAAGL
jgi:hypothetical protein